MRCSDCSRPVKPIVAVDIDGTLGDYHNHFLDFMMGYFGRQLPRGWRGDPPDWESYLRLTQKEYREAKLAFRQGGMKRTMPVYESAMDFMDALVAEDVEIWITTTRPYLRLDSVDPDTQEWLRRNAIPYHHLLYDEHKYARLRELVDPDRVLAIVDDLYEQIQEAALTFPLDVPLQVKRQHNIAHRFGKALNLPDITHIIVNRVKEWNARHGNNQPVGAGSGGAPVVS